jgi:uncharacterized protein YndB with AHSA1/START domain
LVCWCGQDEEGSGPAPDPDPEALEVPVSSPTQSQESDESRLDPSTSSAADVVHVSRTVNAPVERVWQHLISDTGTEALLGTGVRLGSKGESWHSDNGPHGVVRSYHPMEQLRVSWHADDDAPPSLVDLKLSETGKVTTLDLVHEKLSPGDSRDELRSHWDGALDRFALSLMTPSPAP